jgi:hypothetical protein
MICTLTNFFKSFVTLSQMVSSVSSLFINGSNLPIANVIRVTLWLIWNLEQLVHSIAIHPSFTSEIREATISLVAGLVDHIDVKVIDLMVEEFL